MQLQRDAGQIGALPQGGSGQSVEVCLEGLKEQTVRYRKPGLQRPPQECIELGLCHGQVVFRRGQTIGCPSDFDPGPHYIQLGHIPRFETDSCLAQDVPGQVEILAGMLEKRLLQGDPVVSPLCPHAHVESGHLE